MISELFTGSGVAHSILLFSVTIAAGLWLSRFKIKGMGIGSTWILFVGILLGHFGLTSDAATLSLMKDFGLILFVFSIGLQVGPGFFHSFRKGGVLLNALAVGMILLSALVTLGIHYCTGEDLKTMVGVMSGAVTNTPGLGAAGQTLSEGLMGSGMAPASVDSAVSGLSSAYAVAYPLGVLGVLIMLMLFKGVFRINLNSEREALEKADASEVTSARRMHCQVANPALFGQSLASAAPDMGEYMVVSRIDRSGEVFSASPDFILQEGDKVLLVTTEDYVDRIRVIFGAEVPLHVSDWEKKDSAHISKSLVVTKPGLTGKTIRELNIRTLYGVTVTRVERAGIELVARPSLILQVGDRLKVVGTTEGIAEVAALVGNKMDHLSIPNLIPIFFGIACGIILGSLPITIPGIPQPVKLGLAGGPLIVAILLGHFGPRWKITTYTTTGASMMLREIGISIFLAAVGLGAGGTFVSSLTGGGWWWILYGALITFIPILIIGVVARVIFKQNFYRICGLITGATTNPPALAYAQGAFGTDYTSVNYATVYPLSMFMRVLIAQVLILMAL